MILQFKKKKMFDPSYTEWFYSNIWTSKSHLTLRVQKKKLSKKCLIQVTQNGFTQIFGHLNYI